MNIDIDKLIRQAKKENQKQTGIQLGHVLTGDELAKIAELVVRECIDVCLEQRDPANLNYRPSKRFADAIKLKFGL